MNEKLQNLPIQVSNEQQFESLSQPFPQFKNTHQYTNDTKKAIVHLVNLGFRFEHLPHKPFGFCVRDNFSFDLKPIYLRTSTYVEVLQGLQP